MLCFDNATTQLDTPLTPQPHNGNFSAKVMGKNGKGCTRSHYHGSEPDGPTASAKKKSILYCRCSLSQPNILVALHCHGGGYKPSKCVDLHKHQGAKVDNLLPKSLLLREIDDLKSGEISKNIVFKRDHVSK